MVNRPVFFVLLLCLCLGGCVMCPASHLFALEKEAEPALSDCAFDEAVKSFGLLSAFFNEADFRDIYPIPLHGRNYHEAYEYLLTGFDHLLAAAILDAYTCTAPDGALMIIPCERVPLLTAPDRAQAAILSGPDFTVIQVPLRDCYRPGDLYCYRVTSCLIERHWKITALSLTEIPVE